MYVEGVVDDRGSDSSEHDGFLRNIIQQYKVNTQCKECKVSSSHCNLLSSLTDAVSVRPCLRKAIRIGGLGFIKC